MGLTFCVLFAKDGLHGTVTLWKQWFPEPLEKFNKLKYQKKVYAKITSKTEFWRCGQPLNPQFIRLATSSNDCLFYVSRGCVFVEPSIWLAPIVIHKHNNHYNKHNKNKNKMMKNNTWHWTKKTETGATEKMEERQTIVIIRENDAE